MGVITQDKINLQSVKSINDKADAAQTLADSTNQHFWFTSTGTDTGAHITEVTQEDFTDPTSASYQSGGNLLARSNGIAVRDGMTELAVFDTDSFDLYDAGGANIFHVGYDTTRIVTDTFVGDGSTTAFTLTATPVGEVTLSLAGGTVSGNTLTYSTVPARGVEFTATYENASARPYYTLGIRNGNAGNYSTAEGYDTTASSLEAHAEGYSTVASGFQAHSEGYLTTASGARSHAGGWDTTAKATCATAIGFRTIADEPTMLACGRYNTEYGAISGIEAGRLFAIGCGSSTERKDAVIVTDTPSIYILEKTVLYNAIVDLEWGGEVIV